MKIIAIAKRNKMARSILFILKNKIMAKTEYGKG
jgi:hypothetical protein